MQRDDSYEVCYGLDICIDTYLENVHVQDKMTFV